MLQIRNIRKQYRTGSLVQNALNDVSLNLRENEFVAILGPSGSGKTTLLNIIGGLDRYDSGDLVINGISTKKYKDRDWDSYRNHPIGFVFQSYNLIPHQTILSNVELALTISGISRAERKKRAADALAKVGLGDQIHKKPNQMSGGQMQRVAIARALVNDPDILLADEPTGALDSETSVQVMDLLKEVAKNRLVVMVTHNPELAHEYATRIVVLKDGLIQSDSDPYEADDAPVTEYRNLGKASMSFLTALSLSLNNLLTKKTRTILVSFAGSIGIIGIALILSLSNGVNRYIASVEEETLSEYPLAIQTSGISLSNLVQERTGSDEDREDEVTEVRERRIISGMFSQMRTNDLESLKTYLESSESHIDEYARTIEYSYSNAPQIWYVDDSHVRRVHPDQTFASLGIGASGSSPIMNAVMTTNIFYPLPSYAGLYRSQYDLKAGHWPENKNECVIVLGPSGSITDFMLYALGLKDPDELEKMIKKFAANEEVTIEEEPATYKFEDLTGISFKVISSTDYYVYDEEYQLFRDKSDDKKYIRSLLDDAETLTVSGVVMPNGDSDISMLTIGIAYTDDLSKEMIGRVLDSEITKKQLADPTVNVFTGNSFAEDAEENAFDMNSLFAVNEDALQNLFTVDTDKLKLDTSALDFGNMDFSDMLDLSSIGEDINTGMDIGSILSQLDIKIDQEKLQTALSAVAEDYIKYASSDPASDITKLGESLNTYMGSAAARNMIADQITSTIYKSGITLIDESLITDPLNKLIAGFTRYIALNPPEDPEKISDDLTAYLATEEAQAVITEASDSLTQQLAGLRYDEQDAGALLEDLYQGYEAYAEENAAPMPENVIRAAVTYFSQDTTRTALLSAVTDAVDTADLQRQLNRIISDNSESMSSTASSLISRIMTQVMGAVSGNLQEALTDMFTTFSEELPNAFSVNIGAFEDAVSVKMDQDEMSELFMSLMTQETASYDGNLSKIGYSDLSTPFSISIYPKDFDSKQKIIDILEEYNRRMQETDQEEKVITYTDIVGALMSSVTNIIDTISYVLVAFVAISLVVSSIMIGVITYISVLERQKEIGILRAIGASKRNISQVFNAETFIIGLLAGIFGIVITKLLLIPGNAVIHSIAGRNDINAVLPMNAAFILIALSVVLTLIGGIIPSRKAASSDPVAALRTE